MYVSYVFMYVVNQTVLLSPQIYWMARQVVFADMSDIFQAALRVTVKTRGCAGNFCDLEYAKEKQKMDEEITAHGVKVFIEGKSLFKILVCWCRHCVYAPGRNTTFLPTAELNHGLPGDRSIGGVCVRESSG